VSRAGGLDPFSYMCPKRGTSALWFSEFDISGAINRLTSFFITTTF